MGVKTIAGIALVVMLAVALVVGLGGRDGDDAVADGTGAKRAGGEAAGAAGAETARGGEGSGRPAGGGEARGGQSRSGGPGGAAGGRGGRSRETLVVTRSVGSGVTGDRLMALGDGEAAASVTVVPEGTGVLREVGVRSGQRIAAGDVLARLDAEAEKIARDIAVRAVSDAEATRGRRASLIRSQAGTQADLDAADNELARARLTLREAELALARRAVVAPIAGVVGIVEVEPGDRVTPDTAIATIDDRTTLRVDFRVPERFAAQVAVDQPVRASSFALPGIELAGTISAIGSRVEADSRTLPLQAVFDNADDRLRPGMSFSLELAFEGETLPAVDPLAVRWDADGSHVWRVADGKAQRVPARIVQRDADAVLIDAGLAEGDEVVVEGLLSLRDGAAVRVEGAPPGGERGAGGSGAREGGEGREAGGGGTRRGEAEAGT